MSSLIVSHDLHLMMLELAVDKITIPDSHIFDSVTLRKTTLMFRTFDNNWIDLKPQEKNYRQYNGTNKQDENFNGGKSVVFAISESCLQQRVTKANIKIRVFKEISKYFDTERCYDAGVTYVDIHPLFNAIVKELKERKDMKDYYTFFHKREPISRSMKGTFTFTSPKTNEKTAEMLAYIRLSHFGKSIITEFNPTHPNQVSISEETYEGTPYQFTELTTDVLESGRWGGEPTTTYSQNLECNCTESEKLLNVQQSQGWTKIFESSDSEKGEFEINEKNQDSINNVEITKNGKKVKKKNEKKSQKKNENIEEKINVIDEKKDEKIIGGKIEKNKDKIEKNDKKLKNFESNNFENISEDFNEKKGKKRKKNNDDDDDDDDNEEIDKRKRQRKMTSKSKDKLVDDDGIELRGIKRRHYEPLTDDEEEEIGVGRGKYRRVEGMKSPREIARRREYLKSTAMGRVTIGLDRVEKKKNKGCGSMIRETDCLPVDCWCYCRLPILVCGYDVF